MTAQVLGIVDLFWQNSRVDIEPGAKLTYGGVRNKAVVVGRTVRRAGMMVASEVTATSVVNAGEDVTTLFATGEGELQVICDTGQKFVWGDAFLVDAPSITAGEGGKVELHWSAGEPQAL